MSPFSIRTRNWSSRSAMARDLLSRTSVADFGRKDLTLLGCGKAAHGISHPCCMSMVLATPAWSALPIIIATHRRGKDSKDSKTANRHKDGLQIIEEAKSFLEVTGLPMPQDKEEWRLMFKEMGSFLATKSFLTNTPPPVMQLPVADIHDSKEAMRYRAICDERVTLPMEALRSVPSVYQALMRDLHASSMVEVKVNWRCNTKRHWHARVDDPVLAGQLYAKLGYSVEQIAAFGCVPPPAGTAGAQGPGTDPRGGSHHMDLGIQTVAPAEMAPASDTARYPPVTVYNVSSICSPKKKKKEVCGSKSAHLFWATAECGLILPSISAWEVVSKEPGVTTGGYKCKYCLGFWRAKDGGTRFVQIQGAHRGHQTPPADP